MTLSLFPARPDVTRLAAYIADLPGGRHIGDDWRTDPPVLLSVDLKHGAPSVIEAAAEAYPPHPTPRFEADPDNHDRGALVFVVPQTVAGAAAWEAADPDLMVVCWLGQDALDGRNPADLVEHVARLWVGLDALTDDADLLGDVVDRVRILEVKAEIAGVPLDQTIEIAAGLLADIERTPAAFMFEDLADIAVALARTSDRTG